MERIGTLAVMILTMLPERKSELCAQEMVSIGNLNLHSLHTTLSRMERDKFLLSVKKTAPQLRSNHARKYYKSTALGRKELVAWEKQIAKIKKES